MNKYIDKIKNNLKFANKGACITEHNVIMKIVNALDIKDICSPITVVYWPVYSLYDEEIAFKWMDSFYKDHTEIVHDDMYDKFDDSVWEELYKIVYDEIRNEFEANITQKDIILTNLRREYLRFMLLNNDNIEDTTPAE